MKLNQKSLNVFKFSQFARIFATRNDEKNTNYIMSCPGLFFCCFTR